MAIGGTNSLAGFGTAPPKNVALPPNANITCSELITFLPYAAKSIDIPDRLICNGANMDILTRMFNKHRNLPNGRELANNYYYKMIAHTMKKGGFGDAWTVNKHQQLRVNMLDHTLIDWNTERLSTRQIRTEADLYPNRLGCKGGNKEVPMLLLASGVIKFLEGNEALDLTRVVQYAVDHPVDKYKYPRDYHLILSALGGPKPVTPENTDAAIFQIYKSMRKTDLASDKLMKKAGLTPALRPSRATVKERTDVASDKLKDSKSTAAVTVSNVKSKVNAAANSTTLSNRTNESPCSQALSVRDIAPHKSPKRAHSDITSTGGPEDSSMFEFQKQPLSKDEAKQPNTLAKSRGHSSLGPYTPLPLVVAEQETTELPISKRACIRETQTVALSNVMSSSFDSFGSPSLWNGFFVGDSDEKFSGPVHGHDSIHDGRFPLEGLASSGYSPFHLPTGIVDHVDNQSVAGPSSMPQNIEFTNHRLRPWLGEVPQALDSSTASYLPYASLYLESAPRTRAATCVNQNTEAEFVIPEWLDPALFDFKGLLPGPS
jgi:hypothetical protein